MKMGYGVMPWVSNLGASLHISEVHINDTNFENDSLKAIMTFDYCKKHVANQSSNA